MIEAAGRQATLHERLAEVGGSYFRRSGRQPVMISHCSLTLGSESDVERCCQALMTFDLVLRRRPDSATHYEWANVRIADRELSMDIYWYDQAFFERRKDAFRVGAHPLAFQRFGATPDDFQIAHIRPRDSAVAP